MKNKLSDLNDHLFAQLERLGDESLDEKALKLEMNRAKAIGDVAKQLVDTGKLAIEHQRVINETKDFGGKRAETGSPLLDAPRTLTPVGKLSHG